MTACRKFLGRALVLAALTTLAGAAVANASPSRAQHQKHIVGRLASLSATGFTINGKTLTATRAQLARLLEGQCVEVEARLRRGAVSVLHIEREDRCAPLPVTPANRAAPHGDDDDPLGHDAGDDHGRHGNDG
jgi:hypothetical protein